MIVELTLRIAREGYVDPSEIGVLVQRVVELASATEAVLDASFEIVTNAEEKATA